MIRNLLPNALVSKTMTYALHTQDTQGYTAKTQPIHQKMSQRNQRPEMGGGNAPPKTLPRAGRCASNKTTLRSSLDKAHDAKKYMKLTRG